MKSKTNKKPEPLVLKKKPGKNKKKVLAGSRVKLNFKRHFMPPLAGLMVAVLVFGFFNSALLSARIAYYLESRHAATATLDAKLIAAPVDKNAPPSIIINKINVNAPVIYDQKIVNEDQFLQDLKSGVVHYPNTAFPGQQGNVVIFGHSSGQWWAPGNYKFVFTLLDKLQIQDLIYLNYQGNKYVYRVYDITVVDPTDLSVLNQGSNKTLTLLTCTPVGTSARRLVIRAQQILPKATNNITSTQAATLPTGATGKLPGNSSSFWSDLKSLF